MNASAERMVHTGGVELCVQSFGDPDDPAILLIAGGASSMLHWAEEFCDRLAAGRRFVIRLPGLRIASCSSTGSGSRWRDGAGRVRT